VHLVQDQHGIAQEIEGYWPFLNYGKLSCKLKYADMDLGPNGWIRSGFGPV